MKEGLAGRLVAAVVVIKLPCADGCPFYKACAKKYINGTCVDRVESFTKANVYGKRSSMFASHGEIKFTTVEPSGTVTISEGRVIISR